MTGAGGKHNTVLMPKFTFSLPYLENMILHERTTPSYKLFKKCSKADGSETHVASFLLLYLSYFDILVSSHPHIQVFHILSPHS